jgi:hypothetical protein
MINRTLAALAAMLFAAGCATAGSPDATAKPAGKAGAPRDPAFRAADFDHKDGAALDALLGAPDLTRVEGAGEFRRYTLADCALMIILYPDDAGVKRTARLDAGALTSGGDRPDLDACLARGKRTEP